MADLNEKVIDRYRKFHAVATNAASAENEKIIARRRMEVLEKEYPGIGAAAYWSAERAAETAEDWVNRARGRPPPREAPRRPRTYRVEPEPAEPAESPETQTPNWRKKFGQFIQDVVEQVSEGLSITNVVQRRVKITIEADQKTVNVSIKIPVSVALEVAENSGGSLGEFSRLVGVRLGNELAKAFEESGY
jgi:acyl CoA:acetate/3-ketoacid CoA transferase